MGRNREEHLDWCKQRALEYVESGELGEALASMVSDLSEHEDTLELQTFFWQLTVDAMLADDADWLRQCIEGLQ